MKATTDDGFLRSGWVCVRNSFVHWRLKKKKKIQIPTVTVSRGFLSSSSSSQSYGIHPDHIHLWLAGLTIRQTKLAPDQEWNLVLRSGFALSARCLPTVTESITCSSSVISATQATQVEYQSSCFSLRPNCVSMCVCVCWASSHTRTHKQWSTVYRWTWSNLWSLINLFWLLRWKKKVLIYSEK